MPLTYRSKSIQTLTDIDLEGKSVFYRVDFNVPLDNGAVGDETRIRAAISTLRYLLESGARPVVASHLGRPKGKPNTKYSMLPVAERLANLLDREVIHPDDCIGDGVKRILSTRRAGSVVLLENLRFHPEEEANGEAFARDLKGTTEVYISDAFGAVHRKHASVFALPALYSARAVGFLMEKELAALTPLLEQPKRPFGVILGGAKVSDKIKVIEHLLPKIDQLYLGGAMVFTFLRALGKPVGASLVEEDRVAHAKKILDLAAASGVKVEFPCDYRLGRSVTEPGDARLCEAEKFPDGWMGLDIGPRTLEVYGSGLKKCATLFWNGPLGLFEKPPYDQGTVGMARVLAEMVNVRVIGGGDSAAAVVGAGLAEKMTHVSTGGGATLELLEGNGLPGLDALAV